MLHGPSSKRRPVLELQPGPPFNQRIKGASFGRDLDSKNLNGCQIRLSIGGHAEMRREHAHSNTATHQKKRCLSSAMSRYPEYCFTDASQRSGSVTLNWCLVKDGCE